MLGEPRWAEAYRPGYRLSLSHVLGELKQVLMTPGTTGTDSRITSVRADSADRTTPEL